MKRITAKGTQIPAAVGGWNARDSLAEMEDTDAVLMENIFPGTTDVTLRYGKTNHATGLGGQVQTLAPYASGSSNKLKAITENGSIFDVTSSGAVGAAEVTGLSNGKFQFVNFTTSAGSYLCLVNGADKRRVYDGSSWFVDGDGAPYDITNVSSENLAHIHVFKSRQWFIQKSTLKAWYLPINAIGGAATALDLSGVFQDGGALQAMATWTIDAGYGVDDYAVWITTKGELAVYRLTDPTTPTGIALIGIWEIGAPVGRRCFTKYAGDLLIVTEDGVLPLSSALQSSRFNPKVSLTDKITQAMSAAVASYGSNFGWELTLYPKENQLYLNVPVSEGASQEQYVMNTITKNWCNFTDWEANTFAVFNEDLYYGGNAVVCQAWNGNQDAGTQIEGRVLQAFNDFDSPILNKRFTMIRPIFFSDGSPQIYGNINVDYDTSDATAALTYVTPTTALWDTAVWDTDVWGGGQTVLKNWQGANGIGKTGAIQLKIAASGIVVRHVSTDIVFEPGAIL